MKNKKGFTFIETLVVIGIVAILATTVVVAINPTRRFEDARDKQREIHLQTILSAIERKTTIEAGWFDDDNCDSLPQATSTEVVDGKEVELPLFKIIGTATTTEDTYYDLFKCLVPKYMVNPLYDPDGGSENDTHYQIWQNPQTKYITLLYVSEKDPNKKIVAGAKKYGIAKIPTVETASITKITHISAEGGGNVTDDGGSSVFESGVVWDTHPNPTYSDNIGRTVDSSGITKFDSTITGLTSNTTYYVRAYARNDIGVGYGNEEPNVSFSTPDLRPVVETSLADNVTHETADLWGKILTLGEAPVTTYFCWGETENLVENCSGVNRISGEPGTINVPVSFSAFLGKDELIIDDLESKDYYFKACGHNNSGDRCGSIVKFTIQKGKPYVMTI